MSYLVDSDWIIDTLNGTLPTIEILQQLESDGLAISVVTIGEVYEGAFQSSNPEIDLDRMRRQLANYSLLGLSPTIMEIFARTRAGLRRRGQLIADLDPLIASTAIAHDLTLITRNLRHFSRIPNLQIYQSS